MTLTKSRSKVTPPLRIFTTAATVSINWPLLSSRPYSPAATMGSLFLRYAGMPPPQDLCTCYSLGPVLSSSTSTGLLPSLQVLLKWSLFSQAFSDSCIENGSPHFHSRTISSSLAHFPQSTYHLTFYSYLLVCCLSSPPLDAKSHEGRDLCQLCHCYILLEQCPACNSRHWINVIERRNGWMNEWKGQHLHYLS